MGWLSDIGNAVSSAASAVGDAVEDGVDAVVDTVEDAADTVIDTVQDGVQAGSDWLCRNAGTVGCAVGNFVGGLIDGALEGIQDLLHDALDLVRDLGGIIGSILRLDLPGLLQDLGTLGLDIVDIIIDAGRFVSGGYFVGGIVGYFKREALIEFVEDLVANRFGAIPQLLAFVRSKIGLDGGRFGFPLPAEHRVFVLDSNTVPLWQLHRDGTLDLYAMAGLLSFDSFAIGAAHPNTVVKSVGSDGEDNLWPVSRWTIAKYLESEGRDRRLRVYAMSRRIIARNLRTASRKLDEIGVVLKWNDGENFSWFRTYDRQYITKDEYDFNTGLLETLLARPEYNRPGGENCKLLALGAFKLDKLGQTAGRDILQCNDFPADCRVLGRTDRCCNTIAPPNATTGVIPSSGVIYRDSYPSDLFQYVLGHEIGHYVGLCHCCHSAQDVMWTWPPKDPDAHWVSSGLVSYYWESEPHFSLDDGKNAWRFIVYELASCLTGQSEPPVVLLRPERRVQSSRGSCAERRDIEHTAEPS
jgi:hypothetical protein